MTAALVFLACLAGVGQQDVVRFVLPRDVQNPDGVRLLAQTPDPGIVLFEKDAERPKLWYAPVATRPIDGGVRIWYQRVNSSETEYSDQRTLCVGELREGVWVLPELSPDPPAWGGPNNVCMRRSPHRPTWGGFNVFQLVEHRGTLNMLYWDQPDEAGQAGAMLATSADGITWDKQPGAVFTEHNDAYTLLRVGDEFLLYQTALEDWPDKPYPDNLDKKRRIQKLRTSKDLVTWSPQDVLLRPDSEDAPETEFYLMKVFPYGEVYLALIMKYYGDPNMPNKHSAILKNELAVSADARTWERPFRDTDLGFWAYGDPFRLEGALNFAVWKDNGMVTVSYSPNRLVGVTADETGTFETRWIEGEIDGMTVDADASAGAIEFDALDTDGRSFATARVAGLNDVSIPLPWTFVRIAGPQGYRLRIRLDRATLFALRPSP